MCWNRRAYAQREWAKEGEPDVTLYAFDMWNQTGKTYESRYNILLEVICQQPQVHDVRYNTINTHKELLAYADTDRKSVV